MKQKSPDRVKTELWKTLLPEIALPTFAHDINEFLCKRVRTSALNADVANDLAAYLILKYSVSNRKLGKLRSLIERHFHDFAIFLDKIRFKEFRALTGTRDQVAQPSTVKELVQELLKPPGQIPSPTIEPPLSKRKPRPRPKTEEQRTLRRKQSKNRYEVRRRDYRRGLIVEQFGTVHFATLDPRLIRRPEGPCLDVLFNEGAIRMAGCAGSLEDLFGLDRHRLPKRLRPKRQGSNQVYNLRAFEKCLTHLLANREGERQWLSPGPLRKLVLTGIIDRAYRHSAAVGNSMAKRLRPYLS